MDRKNVIYYEFTGNYRSHIIDYLYINHNWKPVLLSGLNTQSMEQWLGSEHNNCILQDGMTLRQGQFDYSKIGKPVPIDEEVLDSLAKYELNFLGILPDATGWNFGFFERKRHYYEMLKYWNTVIQRLKPDIFVSFTWPHTQNCYALYLLCKHYYNIDVLFIDPVPLLDNHYHLVGTSVEELYKPLNELYKSDEELIPSHEVSKYINGVRSKSGKSPGYMLEFYKEYDRSFYYHLKYYGVLFVKTLLKGTGFNKGPFDWKKNRKPYYQQAAIMNYFEHILFSIKLIVKNKRLRKFYDPYCVQPNYEKKYLYFAAPYQPEAVTATNAGVYEDVFLVLDILSTVIPEDWAIYYKEHPSTFVDSFKGALRRDKYFYDKIRLYNNVVMIPSKTDTFNLIDHSHAVATMAGTVAWESALRGKPSLSFGSAWYQGCKSIFTIKTLQDAQDAINKIDSNYIPDQDDLERYAASIERVAVKGMVHRNFHREIEKLSDPKVELQRIGKAIYDAYDRCYKA